MSADLLDAAFLARLEALGLRARSRVRGQQGERDSRRRGHSLEFADHREYRPGDDIRHLDWQVAARLDRLFVKLFEAREDRTVEVLLDRTASMDGPRWDAARKAAAAFAFVSLCALDRVQVFTLDERSRASDRPVRGRSAVPGIFSFLSAARPTGRTDLPAAAETLPPPRTGALSVLISDLLDPSFEAAIARLSRRGEAYALHVVHGPELRGEALRGDLLLVDAETGDEVAVSIDGSARDAYRDAVEAWLARIDAACKKSGVTLLRLDAAHPVEETLLRFLREAAA